MDSAACAGVASRSSGSIQVARMRRTWNAAVPGARSNFVRNAGAAARGLRVRGHGGAGREEILDQPGEALLDAETVTVEVLGPEEPGGHVAHARRAQPVQELVHQTVRHALLPVALGDHDLLQM